LPDRGSVPDHESDKADGVMHRRIVMTWRRVFDMRTRGIADDDRHGMAWGGSAKAGSPLIEPLVPFES
jgi:hypothetical protein